MKGKPKKVKLVYPPRRISLIFPSIRQAKKYRKKMYKNKYIFRKGKIKIYDVKTGRKIH